MDNLPTKLSPDFIAEVTFEARFEYGQSAVPEVVVGRLADTPAWRGFVQRRLGAADIPGPLRKADPNLRYQPYLELLDPSNNNKFARVGPEAVSFHCRAPYPGWQGGFGAEVRQVASVIFKIVPGVWITRLGLRYINALTSTAHHIQGMQDLTLKVDLAGTLLHEKLNVNYTVAVGRESSCTVRLATVDLAQGVIPEGSTVIADLDVYTNNGYRTQSVSEVDDWIEFAHNEEKKNFFRLLPPEKIDRLRED